jgi:CheY-like chemotaxis protein
VRQQPRQGSPACILVADDNAALREVWTEALIGAGYRVLTAGNGREALDLLRVVLPDVIVLDLRMPQMDGPSFLKSLQDMPMLPRIPVLIVSGFLDDESPRASLGLNIVDRLPKPVRLEKLLGTVRAALAAVQRPA